MEQYKDILRKILAEGVPKSDRTGVGTLSIFGYQNRYKMADGFPLVTIKKTHFKSIVHELLWFLKGDTNIQYLVKNNVKIWNEWAYQRYERNQISNAMNASTIPVILSPIQFIEKIKEDDTFAQKYGNLGPIYGKQWTRWESIKPTGKNICEDPSDGPCYWTGYDQIAKAIGVLKTNPEDRGIIVSGWNVADLEEMALRPCHTMFQFYAVPLNSIEREQLYNAKYPVDTDDLKTDEIFDKCNIPKYKLSLQLYQRSADTFLGVPFNIASYSLLLHMVAQVVNMVPDEFIHTFGDVHLYNNSIDQAKEILTRECLPLPTLKLNPKITNIFDFKFEDIELDNYNSHPGIKVNVAV